MNDLKYLLFCILKQNLCPLYLVDADYAWLDSTKGKWANMFFLILLNHHLEHNIMTHVCHLSWTSCNRLTPPNETPAANPVIPSLSKTSGGSDKMFQQFPESYWNLGQHGVLCAAIQTVSSNAKCDRLPLTWKSVTNHPQNIRYLVIVRDFRKRGAGVLFSENPVTAHKQCQGANDRNTWLWHSVFFCRSSFWRGQWRWLWWWWWFNDNNYRQLCWYLPLQ